MSPHSRPSRSSEIDIDARTPMFCRYSMWMGETLRSVACVRSSGVPLAGSVVGTMGTGV